MKALVTLVVLVGLGAVAWYAFPALRGKAKEYYKSHLEWTEEARRADPEGYMEFAIARLKEDTEKLDNAAKALRQQSAKLQKVHLEHRSKLESSTQLAEGFKAKYQEAKAVANGFPVVVADKPYTEQQLLSQVKLVLSETKNFESIIAQCDKALATQETKYNELVNRVSESKAKLTHLEAQKTILTANKITKDTETMLANVNELIAQNEAELSGEGESPVRTVDEILKGSSSSGDTGTAVMDKEVEAFLKG